MIEHVPSPAEHLERACDQVAAGGNLYLERNGGLVALNEQFRWSSLRRPGFGWQGLTGGFVNQTDEVQLIFRRAG